MRTATTLSFFRSAFFFGSVLVIAALIPAGCAQIGAPSGGVRDSLAPRLIRAVPPDGSRNVTSKTITLAFDEYIDVQDLQQNLLISPLQKRSPVTIINTKSITLRFRDTLQPNTTYTLNFGNAVRDINEGNVYRGLSYSFSTGPVLDSLTLGGKVALAETGKVDSTLLVMLYRHATDSSVQKVRPDYIAKVNGNGSFRFTHLPADSFRIYAIKDVSGSRTYASLSELFAFYDTPVLPGSSDDIDLFAYVQQPQVEKPATTKPTTADKKLRVSVNRAGTQDLFKPLEIDFNNPLKTFDSTAFSLTDTLYRRTGAPRFTRDSTGKKIFLAADWQPDTHYILVIPKEAVADSAGNFLAKNDTARFTTKRNEDYGNLVLRFTGLDLSAHPLLQFLSGDAVKYSYPLSSDTWSQKMFTPGDYTIRIVYDTDQNGKWSPGNYVKKLQPELTVTLPQTLSVRADWDNEREISL